MSVKNIIAVSHCILNDASKVVQWEPDRGRELKRKLVSEAIEAGTGIVQLPCPEFAVFGPKRWGHVYEQFDSVFYRRACRELLERTVIELAEYAAHKDRFRVIGVLGIQGSPTCGVDLTCSGEWGGELSGRPAPVPPAEMVKGSGVMMEELRAMLRERGLEVGFCAFDPSDPQKALSFVRGGML